MTEAVLDQAPRPPCYGLFWEAIPGTPDCEGCFVKDGCLHKFATETLPVHRAKIGDDLEGLAKSTEVRQEALRVAINHAQSFETPKSKRRPVMANPDPKGNGSGPETASPVAAVAPIEDDGQAVLALEPTPKGKKKAPTKTKAPTKAKESAQPVKKAPAKKKKAAAKAPQAVQNPPVAGPAKSALGPATATKTNAKDATAQGYPRKKRKPKVRQKRYNPSYPDKKMRLRWEREREKYPELGCLVPGMCLRDKHRGEVWEARVGEGYYLYEGQKYPTAQALTTAITGAVVRPKQRAQAGNEETRPEGQRLSTNWGWRRFLRRVLEEVRPR